jgi:hypothetical protein
VTENSLYFILVWEQTLKELSYPLLLQPTNLAFILVIAGFAQTINPDSKGLLARILRFNSRSNLTILDSHNLNLVLGDAARGR